MQAYPEQVQGRAAAGGPGNPGLSRAVQKASRGGVHGGFRGKQQKTPKTRKKLVWGVQGTPFPPPPDIKVLEGEKPKCPTRQSGLADTLSNL